MVFGLLGFDDHVINVCLHSCAEHGFENISDHTLVGSASVLEAERHDIVAIGTVLGHE